MAINDENSFDFENRTIYIFKAFEDNDFVVELIKGFKKLEKDKGPIKIVMNSVGGDESIGYVLFDIISQCKNHITIDCFGTCSSMAVAVLQAADTRRASINCDFLIHGGNQDNKKNLKPHELIEAAENCKKSDNRYHSIIADRSNFSLDQVKELCNHESYFLSSEALKHGLIDEIIESVKVYKKKKGNSK